MTERQDISFAAGGVQLAGWFYPAGDGAPVIVMSHGLSAIRRLNLDEMAKVFQAAGLAVLCYDHRNFGDSGGEPRQEADPWAQVRDMRDAITFARTIPGIDPERLGIWGTSYSGGHVLTVAALDRRVKCVVSQVPFTHGARTFDTWVPERAREKTLLRMQKDREARYAGAAPETVPAAIEGTETEEWVKKTDTHGDYVNALTLRSLEMLREYEPHSFAARIAPTPLMMIVADRDTQTPTAGQLETFELANEPKKLVRLDCRHYDPYMSHIGEASAAARDWFLTHLG
ncbi:MAG: alpha/beta hydrolase [Minwuia sp.]|uniref:alpha/beta hydrolase n=1 Tax=Minwuia sp. TaxID=2493630 RepID=UPI003A8BCD58